MREQSIDERGTKKPDEIKRAEYVGVTPNVGHRVRQQWARRRLHEVEKSGIFGYDTVQGLIPMLATVSVNSGRVGGFMRSKKARSLDMTLCKG
jgi:hypothetical protein